MLKPVLQPQKPTARKYLTISQLNRQVKNQLEQSVGQVLIEGEISNFIAAGSGHWYFTLKDANAQVKCTMWRGRNQQVKFRPEDGLKIYARAKVTLYEARGDYQLAVDFMEPAGLGDLQLQFEQLKTRLAAEGLFDQESKLMIPENPSRVGVVTSPTGAAIRDVLTVMRRRFPLTEVIIYPCQVQGKTAHKTIIDAIHQANQRQEVDVILLTRGGGSLEDLWCFNEPDLAYAIHQSPLPIVSAVGHEVDFTISDFVADLRAPTPSAAAEILTPDQFQMSQRIDSLQFDLRQSIALLINQFNAQLDVLKLQLTDPEPLLASYSQQLQQLFATIQHRIAAQLHLQQDELRQKHLRLVQQDPKQRIDHSLDRNQQAKQRLKNAMQVLLKQGQQALAATANQLNTVSPLATLSRGYSITLRDDHVVRSASSLSPGDNITTKFADGEIISTVKPPK